MHSANTPQSSKMSSPALSSSDVEISVPPSVAGRERVPGTTVVSSSRDDDFDETVS